jgi:hypothetical protein
MTRPTPAQLAALRQIQNCIERDRPAFWRCRGLKPITIGKCYAHGWLKRGAFGPVLTDAGKSFLSC